MLDIGYWIFEGVEIHPQKPRGVNRVRISAGAISERKQSLKKMWRANAIRRQKRNRYTAVKSATAIRRSKAQPLYSSLSPDEASFFTALPRAARGPPRNGRGSSRHTALTGGGPPRRTKPASPGEGTPPTGGGPLAKEFLRALSFNSKFNVSWFPKWVCVNYCVVEA